MRRFGGLQHNGVRLNGGKNKTLRSALYHERDKIQG